jgi:hypothetical protein
MNHEMNYGYTDYSSYDSAEDYQKILDLLDEFKDTHFTVSAVEAPSEDAGLSSGYRVYDPESMTAEIVLN